MGLDDWLERGGILYEDGLRGVVIGGLQPGVFQRPPSRRAPPQGHNSGRHRLASLHPQLGLLEILRRLGREVPEEVLKEADWLEPHYVLARYPVRGVKQYTEAAARRCVSAMELIAGLVEKWSGRSLPRG